MVIICILPNNWVKNRFTYTFFLYASSGNDIQNFMVKSRLFISNEDPEI